MKQLSRMLLPFLCVALLTPVLLLRTSGVISAASCGTWRLVPTPKEPVLDAHFNAVKAISANDVWAVGSTIPSVGPQPSLIEHWNGSAWSVVSNPHPGFTGDTFYAVAATSTNDVWAVGSLTNTNDFRISLTLIEHWNGSRWSVVSSPSPGTGTNELFGVVAISSNDAWAVGHFGNSNSAADSMLAEHWDGSHWSVVPTPNPGTFANRLNSVTALSTNDVWAVGNFFLNGSQGPDQTAVEHWNGSQWSIVTSANVASADDNLISVTAISTNDIWAVGLFSIIGSPGNSQTLTEHWNGSQWKIVASPNTIFSDGLNAIAAIATNDVWAVGDGFNQNATIARTMILHWDGQQWNIVKHPHPTSQDFMSGVSTLPSGQVWAVGHIVGKIIGKPLTETNC